MKIEENKLINVEEKIIEIIPVLRKLDAVLIDDFKNNTIERVPILYLHLIEVTEIYTFGQSNTYRKVKMGDINPFSDINYDGGFEKFDGYLGIEYDGIQKDWTTEINKYKNKSIK